MKTEEFALNIAGMVVPLLFELLKQANMTPEQTGIWIEKKRAEFYAADPDVNPHTLPKA